MAEGGSRNSAVRGGATGVILTIIAVGVAVGIGYFMGWRVTQQTATASCVADGAIDSSVRSALDGAAIDFVNTISGSNPIGAYGMLAGDTKGAITPDKFLAALRPSLDPVAPFSDIHVAHAYYVRGGGGSEQQRVICGNLDQPEHWVAVTAKPVAEQAHLIVDATAKSGHWAFVLWLVPENGWRIAGFDFTATGMAGKSLEEILAMARAQHNQHHDFNAVLLYGAAAHLAARGNNLQLGIEPAIQAELAKLPIPAFLRGKPPLAWKVGDDTYQIDNVGAAGVGDKIYLTITQELSPWYSDNDADTRNRLLIQDFAKSVPEFTATFAGLIVIARDQAGTHLYRTVATEQARTPDRTETKTPTK